MAAPSFKETLWGNGTTSIYFDYTVYSIKNQAPATGCLCQLPHPVKTLPKILNELFSVIGIGAYFLLRETR